MSEILQRVGIIGDPHAEDERLAEAIRFLRGEGVETLICTGDIVTGRGDANRCCASLLENEIPTVRGNHDRWFFAPGYAETLPNFTLSESMPLEARAFLATLEPTRRLATVSGELLLCHGFGTDDMAGIYPGGDDAPIAAALNRLPGERPRLLVAGHTHRRMVRTVAGVTLINPGSLVGGKEPPGFLLADFGAGIVTAYVFDNAGRISLGMSVTLPVVCEMENQS